MAMIRSALNTTRSLSNFEPCAGRNAGYDRIRAFEPENERYRQIEMGRACHKNFENKCKAAQILKDAVPALEKIRDEHQSERLRKAAAKYLEQIAREVG
jgi:hypothetical protein